MPAQRTLLEYVAELVDALSAAGLDARGYADPDRGPAGVVVDIPEFAYTDRPPRVGCQDLATAPVTTDVVVIGAGWAPEQLQRLALDATTAFYAVPVPWRPVNSTRDQSTDAPLYRISCARN